ncbi:MAG: fused MFS/spermidine synthase [Candidatus Krumholzibacteria bacterium]|nr:fused MFS/spermidine synthase [Candidatus Krumholzibacteria bacterium]
MNRAYLYTAVSVGGASVLAVEILGTRIVGPYFGVSIFLWSALIGVTCAALALGYWIGGRWADRGPRAGRFAALFIAAGIWIALVPLLRGPAVDAARPLGHRAALLAVSLALFFPPLAVLGMVSPYALRLRATSLADVGRSAGDLYAVSTLASVAAALLTGYVLVPGFGVMGITLSIGILLAATGIGGLFVGSNRGGTPGTEKVEA